MSMREIKFRAWCPIREMMCKVISINYSSQTIQVEYPDGNGFSDKLSSVVLVQYTGLKDKNGKEIFEGDVVADRDTSDLIFEIKYCIKRGGYFMPDEFDEEYSFSINSVQLEIIGNIHQNPELLK